MPKLTVEAFALNTAQDRRKELGIVLDPRKYDPVFMGLETLEAQVMRANNPKKYTCKLPEKFSWE